MNSSVKGTDSGLELAHTEYTDVHVSQGRLYVQTFRGAQLPS